MNQQSTETTRARARTQRCRHQVGRLVMTEALVRVHRSACDQAPARVQRSAGWRASRHRGARQRFRRHGRPLACLTRAVLLEYLWHRLDKGKGAEFVVRLPSARRVRERPSRRSGFATVGRASSKATSC